VCGGGGGGVYFMKAISQNTNSIGLVDLGEMSFLWQFLGRTASNQLSLLKLPSVEV
jgi:hypothetical protein